MCTGVWLFQPVCARNLCHWLMRHILISKVVCGGFEIVFFGVGLRLMSKKMFSSVTCDRTSQVKELVLQHEVIETMAQGSRRPVWTAWMNTFVTDYSSYYIEVARLCATSTQAVVRELKTMFARFGIPEILVTDNGPQVFRLTSFKYLLGFGLSIMSLHRLATLSQMVKPKTLGGQWSVCLRNARSCLLMNANSR